MILLLPILALAVALGVYVRLQFAAREVPYELLLWRREREAREIAREDLPTQIDPPPYTEPRAN